MGEVDDGQPVAHFWRQEYDFWSSPLQACLQKVASFVVCRVCCVILCLDCRRIALIGRCLVIKKDFDWYMPIECKDFDCYMPIEFRDFDW